MKVVRESSKINPLWGFCSCRGAALPSLRSIHIPQASTTFTPDFKNALILVRYKGCPSKFRMLSLCRYLFSIMFCGDIPLDAQKIFRFVGPGVHNDACELLPRPFDRQLRSHADRSIDSKAHAAGRPVLDRRGSNVRSRGFVFPHDFDSCHDGDSRFLPLFLHTLTIGQELK